MMLDRPELRQLAQRITARYHLDGLTSAETTEYVLHRLRQAGGHESLFRKSTLPLLYRLSGGIPRLINVICDRALLGAYIQGERTVAPRTLRTAAAEVFGRPEKQAERGDRITVQLLTAMTVLVGGIGLAAAIYFLGPAHLRDSLDLGQLIDSSGVVNAELPIQR